MQGTSRLLDIFNIHGAIKDGTKELEEVRGSPTEAVQVGFAQIISYVEPDFRSQWDKWGTNRTGYNATSSTLAELHHHRSLTNR